MPNHITNIVRITDNRDLDDYEAKWAEFKKFAGALRSAESDFDFNAIVPMPADVERGDLTPERQRELGPENNWYDWSRTHWGTKWNSYEVVWIKEAKYDELLVKFETAWTPPIPVFEKITELGYQVEFSFLDEGDDKWQGWFVLEAK